MDGSYETATMMSSLRKWFSHCLVVISKKKIKLISPVKIIIITTNSQNYSP